MLLQNIFLLFDVGIEIVEVLAIAAFEELPFPFANRRLPAPTPCQEFMRSRRVFSAQKWNQVHTVEIPGFGLNARQLRSSRRNVQRNDRMVGPAGIFPGHETTNGTCIPPSASIPFSPFSGSFSEPSQPGPPPGASSL